MTNNHYHARIRRLLLSAASLLFVCLVAPAQAAEEASGEPVMLGGAVDLTAYLAEYDRPLKAGVELAIQAVNERGGVLNGRPLKITFYNMEANPAAGVRVVQRLITAQGVKAILHGFSSASTRAVQPIVASNEIPLIAASVLSDNENFEFTTITPAKYMISTRVAYLRGEGINQVGVLYDGSPYNEIQLQILQKMAEDTGLEIVGVEQHANDAVDLRPQVTALLQEGAKAVIKLSAGPTTIVAAKAMAQADTSAPLVSGIDSLNTHKQAARAYQHYSAVATGPQVYSVLPESERSRSLTRFMELYRESGQTKFDPTYMGRGWDAVWLLANAIEKAGSLDGAAIQKALEEMDPYKGASGTYDFSADTHYGIHQNPFRLIGFGSEGDMKIVYSPDTADHG